MLGIFKYTNFYCLNDIGLLANYSNARFQTSLHDYNIFSAKCFANNRESLLRSETQLSCRLHNHSELLLLLCSE